MADLDNPVVATRSGVVRGVWRAAGSGRSAAFLGMPYAQAPVGDLRFAAPEPPKPWPGIRDARHYGPTAQRAPLSPVTTIPEPSTPGDEVLNLNVFTPAPGDGSAKLPVLVWIHGGGYVAGCQNSPWYDGAAFNRDGVVTVSLGYRLGIDAWLHLAGAPDNRGALDWLAGLSWVQNNIAQFGGDPWRVTVAGQSAGGGAVLTLLGMPSASRLFVRAASFSGAVGSVQSMADAQQLAERFTSITGIPATAEAASGLTEQQTQQVTLALSDGGVGIPKVRLAPVADGSLIPHPASDAVGRGAGSSVPLLLGFTRHEFNGAARELDPHLPAPLAMEILKELGMRPDVAADLAARGSPPVPELIAQALTDATFRRLGLDVAEGRARFAAGMPVSAEVTVAPTWLYEFAWRSKAVENRGLAFHCLDLPFWWDCLGAEQVEAATGPRPPQHLADAMHAALVRWVSGDGPGWPAYDVATRPVRLWDEEPSLAQDHLRTVRELWGQPDRAAPATG